MIKYTGAEREQMRLKLLMYMKEHKIGTPILAERIENAHPRRQTVPVKTLQRFLKREGRTNDQALAIIGKFIATLDVADASPRLGLALSAFYASKDSTEWSGSFAALEYIDQNTTRKSTIEIVMNEDLWRVTESSHSKGLSEIHDGVLSSSGPAWIIVMKDRLLGLPRTITIRSLGDGFFDGVTTAAYVARNAFLPAWRSAIQTRHARIELRDS